MLSASLQKFPGDLLTSTYYNPSNRAVILARTEVERRGRYIALLEAPASIGVLYPDLVQLVKQCLQNIPDQRPSTDELLATLQRMKVEVEGEYGGPMRLDMVRVRLAKEVKLKDRRIGELTQLQVSRTCTKVMCILANCPYFGGTVPLLGAKFPTVPLLSLFFMPP